MDIYVCSKPLQYFNIRNIPHLETFSKHRTLIILGSFYDSKKFAINIRKYDRIWDKVIYVTNHKELYLYLFMHHINNLIVEQDDCTIIGILYFFKRCYIYIFEEGFGSYRRDRIKQKKRYQRWIDQYFGVGKMVGFSKYLKGQVLYYPDLYRKRFPDYQKSLYTFIYPFKKALEKNISLFEKLSGEGLEEILSLSNKRILIYITNWSVDQNIIEQMEEKKCDFDYIFVKLHPHIQKSELILPSFIQIIESNILVEFMLLKWKQNNNKVTIYHCSSTSVLYFMHDLLTIDFLKYPEFLEIEKYIYDMKS